eukprot:6212455-Pleurochrysis_carterae.AAC.1
MHLLTVCINNLKFKRNLACTLYFERAANIGLHNQRTVDAVAFYSHTCLMAVFIILAVFSIPKLYLECNFKLEALYQRITELPSVTTRTSYSDNEKSIQH